MPPEHRADNSIGILLWCMSLLDQHMPGGYMSLEMSIVQERRKYDWLRWLGSGAGSLLTVAAMPFDRADSTGRCWRELCTSALATVVVARNGSIVMSATDAGPDRTWRYRRQHQNWTCDSGPAGHCWKWCKRCSDIGLRKRSRHNKAGRSGSSTYCSKRI